jgi:hypothetical protein
MDRIKKGDSKPRWYDKQEEDFDKHDCPDSGGCYQELKSLGDFAECVPGTRDQRLHERNYCKPYLDKPSKDTGLVIKPDTSGPPFQNVSVPHRVP